MGIVAHDEIARLTEALVRDLESFTDPYDGGPVVDKVLRREDLCSGPYSVQVPDILLELRNPDGYSYAAQSSKAGAEGEPLRRLEQAEMTGARGTSMAGAHRAHGICVLHGADVRPGDYACGRLADAGATVLALLGLAPAAGADGRAWSDALATDRELVAGSPLASAEVEEYDRAAAHEVEQRLRALGYVE
jgi:predicted AlkP superfamily phosphohydrolase/phosphomutase